MRLLLDEMISPKIARELSDKGYDVQAITGERPELKSTRDVEIVRRIHSEQRAIVTNNVDDFQPIHQRFIAQGVDHSGMVFTWDASLPRNQANLPLWVETLEVLLKAHPGDDSPKNRVRFLPIHRRDDKGADHENDADQEPIRNAEANCVGEALPAAWRAGCIDPEKSRAQASTEVRLPRPEVMRARRYALM